MTEKIKFIFEQNISLLQQLDRAVCYFRKQQHDLALGIVADSMDLINNSIEAIITDSEYFNLVSTDSVLGMLSSILDSYKRKDYILLADLLEIKLISFINKVQEHIIGKEEIAFDKDRYQENLNWLIKHSVGIDRLIDYPMDPQLLLKEGYRVEFSFGGLMTLVAENNNSQFYFHTNGRITFEALMLAKHWYKKEASRYILYGLGFGYHIRELLAISPRSNITVYESDLNVIMLACAFANIKDIFASGRVDLIYDPDYIWLGERLRNLSKKESFCVHYPSFQNIRNDMGIKLTESYVSWSKNI
ncbi:hypothetical protein [Herbinix luporum]|uniref:DUF115 domain-containing protein n=1 Tax=Herbinix luporum TaxID=1679721 RepID=A0A0K8J3N6_9FIRM|nr:hypothetical protein [Herbinix luporum]CUH91933.1 hypothetical protein SD1D_0380 [Herbinix luporum]HHT56237.1 hypothetical protein [Herbinix luporum]